MSNLKSYMVYEALNNIVYDPALPDPSAEYLIFLLFSADCLYFVKNKKKMFSDDRAHYKNLNGPSYPYLELKYNGIYYPANSSHLQHGLFNTDPYTKYSEFTELLESKFLEKIFEFEDTLDSNELRKLFYEIRNEHKESDSEFFNTAFSDDSIIQVYSKYSLLVKLPTC